jgi:hypothetical protein
MPVLQKKPYLLGGFIFTRFNPVLLQKIHNGKAGYKIGKRQGLFNKIKNSAHSAPPSAKMLVKQPGRNGCPQYITVLAQAGYGIRGVAQNIHYDTKQQGGDFLFHAAKIV